jgi:hypothetical protein
MMARIIMIFASAVSLAACSSYGDMLQRAPYKVVAMSGGNQVLADCFHSAMLKHSGYDFTLLRSDDSGGPHVAGQLAAAGGGGDFVLFDVAFSAKAADRTDAVIRAKIDAWGNPEIPDYFWSSLNGCNAIARK